MRLADELLQDAESMLIRALGYLATLQEHVEETELTPKQASDLDDLRHETDLLHTSVVHFRKEVGRAQEAGTGNG